MTRYLLLTAVAGFLMVNCNAQDANEVLKKTFMAFDTTMDFQKKVEQSNKLTMIAKKWNDQWAPHYYNAFSKAQLSYMEKDEKKRDAYLDDAEKERDEAVAILGKDNDETYVLSALIANARMTVDPRNRWQKYGKMFEEDLAKAKEINANNPRIYYLKGVSVFFTPKMFGGGKKPAKSYFEKAEPLFAKETEDDITKPFWGKRNTVYFMAQINSDGDKD